MSLFEGQKLRFQYQKPQQGRKPNILKKINEFWIGKEKTLCVIKKDSKIQSLGISNHKNDYIIYHLTKKQHLVSFANIEETLRKNTIPKEVELGKINIILPID